MKILPYGFVILFWLVAPAVYAQRVNIPWPEITDSSDLVDTHSKPIEYQKKKTWVFDNGVHLSNAFIGARVNQAEVINDSTIVITIKPENYPINVSPWYAFKLWDDTPGNVYIRLTYQHGRHRYYPKISRDGQHWTRLPGKDYFSDKEDTTAFFRLHTQRDTLWVSAQEQMTSIWVADWVRMLSARPWVQDTVFGYSTLGKPMRAMLIGNRNAGKVLLILSRQHPPEVTGFKEMVAFVETLSRESKLAGRFRSKYCIIVAPMMNPDGVDNGQWRHNAGGIDLNRDWRWFNQPETFAYRQFILNTLKKYNAKVVYGIDFHSTQTDLFYLPDAKDSPTGKSISRPWIEKINRKFKDHPFSPESSSITEQISKNWILHELHAEAVTYEVGDETNREVIRKRGETSARILMRMLLKEK